MDAFTGKEQNRANVVPMVCQFLYSIFTMKGKLDRVSILAI